MLKLVVLVASIGRAIGSSECCCIDPYAEYEIQHQIVGDFGSPLKFGTMLGICRCRK